MSDVVSMGNKSTLMANPHSQPPPTFPNQRLARSRRPKQQESTGQRSQPLEQIRPGHGPADQLVDGLFGEFESGDFVESNRLALRVERVSGGDSGR